MFVKPAIEDGSHFVGLRGEGTVTRSVITDRLFADGGEVVTAARVDIAQSSDVECGDLMRSTIEDRHMLGGESRACGPDLIILIVPGTGLAAVAVSSCHQLQAGVILAWNKRIR